MQEAEKRVKSEKPSDRAELIYLCRGMHNVRLPASTTSQVHCPACASGMQAEGNPSRCLDCYNVSNAMQTASDIGSFSMLVDRLCLLEASLMWLRCTFAWPRLADDMHPRYLSLYLQRWSTWCLMLLQVQAASEFLERAHPLHYVAPVRKSSVQHEFCDMLCAILGACVKADMPRSGWQLRV